VTYARAVHGVLRVKARDGKAGVATVTVKKPHARRTTKTKRLAPAGARARQQVNTTLRLPRRMRRAYVRAVDAAGNKSRWRSVKFR